MYRADSDAIRRTPGQYARATVRRLRMRTLVSLGVLAVATAVLGRIFGLHDWRFLAAEMALLASMFVISHYVLPLVARRDLGPAARSTWEGCWTASARTAGSWSTTGPWAAGTSTTS